MLRTGLCFYPSSIPIGGSEGQPRTMAPSSGRLSQIPLHTDNVRNKTGNDQTEIGIRTGKDQTEHGNDTISNSSKLQELGWQSGDNSASQIHRSDILLDVIQHHKMDRLQAILGAGGWNANEELAKSVTIFKGISFRRSTTALREAVRAQWTWGVDTLLQAGAKSDRSTLELAYSLQQRYGTSKQIVDLLLAAHEGTKHREKYRKWRRKKNRHIVRRLGWTGGAGTDHVYKRTNIVHAIIANHSTEHLQMIMDHGWDVNEMLMLSTGTALIETVFHQWEAGARMLLEAGADADLGRNFTPLETAINHHFRSMVELLLRHGRADPNCRKPDSRSPIIAAVRSCEVNGYDRSILTLLLEHGADTNAIYTDKKGTKHTPLSAVLDALRKHVSDTQVTGNAALFRTLLDAGGDANARIYGKRPVLHTLITMRASSRQPALFPREHLDLYFRYGGDVNLLSHSQDGNHASNGNTALYYALREVSHANTVRWLLRHGARDTTHQGRCSFFVIRERFLINMHCGFLLEGGLILLQAGLLNLSHTLPMQHCLKEIKHSIEAFLEKVDTEEDAMTEQDLMAEIRILWMRFSQEANTANEPSPARIRQSSSQKFSAQQVLDLEAFSDKSLHFYPETGGEFTTAANAEGAKKASKWRHSLDVVNSTLSLIVQPHTLQWWSRVHIRTSVLSLEPSVIKQLPLPARLKRYILCHEL